jgi:hypothetical protein
MRSILEVGAWKLYIFVQTCICCVISTNTEEHTEIRKKCGSGLQYTEP